jgi:hypothetical protein
MGQGGAGGTEIQICMGGGGVANIGPAVGQTATVVGPTINGGANIGAVIVSAGNGAVG